MIDRAMKFPSRLLEDAARAPDSSLTAEQVVLFEGLYRDYFDFVFRNLRRAGVNDALVDDAVQDVFIVVMRRLSDYRPGSNARAWLFAIISRVASNYRRGERRNRIFGEPADEQPTSERGPLERAESAADLDLLHRFLERVGDDKRDVFILADLEQMTAKEIAAVLKIKTTTVYSRLRVARQELAEFLAAQQPVEEP